jgi:ankyrin repeat protein
VLALGHETQTPETTSAAGMQKSSSRTKVLLPLSELDEKVLSFLKLPGNRADKNKAAKSGYTPLISASMNGHADAVRLLVEAGADKDKVETADGMSALHWAACDGHLEAARILVEAGADRSIRDSHGDTALDLAVDSGHGGVLAADLAALFS